MFVCVFISFKNGGHNLLKRFQELQTEVWKPLSLLWNLGYPGPCLQSSLGSSAGRWAPGCLLPVSPLRGQPELQGGALRVGIRGSGFCSGSFNNQLCEVTSSPCGTAAKWTGSSCLCNVQRVKAAIKMTCIQGYRKTLSIRQMHVIIKEPYFSQIKFKIRGTT